MASSTRGIRRNIVFVFGSNLAGRHGAGAALAARRLYGAKYGQGTGFQGNSYAVPTKDWDLKPLPLDRIALEVSDFLKFAKIRQELEFHVSRLGCGLAGYSDEEIAPMFTGHPGNVKLDPKWNRILAVGRAALDVSDVVKP